MSLVTTSSRVSKPRFFLSILAMCEAAKSRKRHKGIDLLTNPIPAAFSTQVFLSRTPTRLSKYFRNVSFKSDRARKDFEWSSPIQIDTLPFPSLTIFLKSVSIPAVPPVTDLLKMRKAVTAFTASTNVSESILFSFLNSIQYLARTGKAMLVFIADISPYYA